MKKYLIFLQRRARCKRELCNAGKGPGSSPIPGTPNAALPVSSSHAADPSGQTARTGMLSGGEVLGRSTPVPAEPSGLHEERCCPDRKKKTWQSDRFSPWDVHHGHKPGASVNAAAKRALHPTHPALAKAKYPEQASRRGHSPSGPACCPASRERWLRQLRVS